jgi:hypothetical protein
MEIQRERAGLKCEQPLPSGRHLPQTLSEVLLPTLRQNCHPPTIDLAGFTSRFKIDLQRINQPHQPLEQLLMLRGREIGSVWHCDYPGRNGWYSESGVKPNTIIQFDPKTEKSARANIPSGGRVYIACSGVDKAGSWNPLTDISLPGESSL